MGKLLLDTLSRIVAGILPGFITTGWNRYILQNWLGRAPREYILEIRLFLDILFPENPPEIRETQCRFLPNSKAFFMEKVDILDSLGRDNNAEVNIICRVPWLLMPGIYRDIALNSTEARAYYSMLEKHAKSGRLKYLYNLNSLKNMDIKNSLITGSQFHCYPILLSSTNFDIMIVHTDRHRHKIIFAQRPMGVQDQEIGIVVEQRDLYLVLKNYFDRFWKETVVFWGSEIEKNIPAIETVFGYLQE